MWIVFWIKYSKFRMHWLHQFLIHLLKSDFFTWKTSVSVKIGHFYYSLIEFTRSFISWTYSLNLTYLFESHTLKTPERPPRLRWIHTRTPPAQPTGLNKIQGDPMKSVFLSIQVLETIDIRPPVLGGQLLGFRGGGSATDSLIYISGRGLAVFTL